MKACIRLMTLCTILLSIAFISSGSPVMAQLQDAGYTSGVQVANLEDTDATITLTAYDASGGQAATINDTVPGGGSVTYFQDARIPNGFSGSIVISSDKQTAALSNIVTTNFALGASYVGSDAGSTKVLLPLLQKKVGNYYSWFSVQNAGSGPAEVTVSYSTGETATANIPIGTAQVFDQQQEGHPDGQSFSAEINSDQPIVAAVIIEDFNTIFAYTGFSSDTDTSTSPVFPLVNANNSGFVTGIQVQNAGAETTDVTLTYKPATLFGSVLGAECTETQTIEPNTSNTFAYQPFFQDIGLDIETNCAQGELFVGSAVVTTNSTKQPLVGIVNQLKFDSDGVTVQGEAYGSYSPDKATNKVVMPLIMDRNGVLYTGYQIVHVGGPASTISCAYSNTAVAGPSEELAVGGVLLNLQLGQISDRYIGSGTCTASDSATKIVGVVNQLGDGSATDVFYVYEALNVQ